MRRFRPRLFTAVVGAVALTMLARRAVIHIERFGPHRAGRGQAGFQALNPGTPQYGGTLNMVGVSDVDHMDYDMAYYSTDYQALRLSYASSTPGRPSRARPSPRCRTWPPGRR